ncbi:DUF1729 domain-containing protein [Corynebacterium sp. 3HC-13]|uniref:type I polyketide synthase n=1 Tax=Corynebacterium poyangense TaxID=2684405 RepID=UPI001CCFBC99|nr:type I polyketide synthase [Corynebacterium poyangense]MBZ8178232.1 DUF1729 domain-containing protein [Corynebacterium poyangense]
MSETRVIQGDRLVDTIGDTAWVFAGQGVNWLSTLRNAGITPALASAIKEAERKLSLIADEVELTQPRGFFPIKWMNDESVDENADWLKAAAVSVPGITLVNIAVVDSLRQQGVPEPVAVAGHSQGVIGAAYAEGKLDATDSLVVAILIGAAVTRNSQWLGLIDDGENSPMLSVSGANRDDLENLISGLDIERSVPVAISLKNGRDSWVLTGQPEQLSKIRSALEKRATREQKLAQQKLKGGAPFSPKIADLPISVGFHVPSHEDAVVEVIKWARECGVNVDIAEKLARAIMVTPVDWPADVAELAKKAEWILDLGPGTGVNKLTRDLVAGLGVGTLALGTDEGQEALFDAGKAPELPQKYSDYLPEVVIRDGKAVLETRFTKLTGFSPVMLPGMTPSTVDPAIVAAAANAGYWAELAGGGQVTPEILDENVERLKELLVPGATAQFNAMYLNPAQWRMHIEGRRMVPRARANGVPFNGVVVSAGVPPLTEAVELINNLRDAGFSWISFKPGTVQQIRQVLSIADEVPSIPLLMQVEGGKAGGHHSWEDLDELLLATYDETRRRDNIILAVGGGLRGPEHAAEYLSGEWSNRHGYPHMPVDGILVGTAAMATAESTASPSVKEALVKVKGLSGWVASGSGEGDMASGLSQLGADLYEINNSFARAGRLLDSVAGDVEAVAARRDEIIEALSHTAKPFFGELRDMTYQQWLERYVELCFPWVDVTWFQRFEEMLSRAEARLSTTDRGEITALIEASSDVEPSEYISQLLQHYPDAADTTLHPADRSWFLALLDRPGKPAPFVPIIDGEVRRWFRQDSLWQAHDDRYDADQVCIIPGIAAVDAIEKANEPVADLLGRYEAAAVRRVGGEGRVEERTPVVRVLNAHGTVWAGRYQTSLVERIAPRDQWELSSDGHRASLPSGAELVTQDNRHVQLSVPLADQAQLVVRITLPERDNALSPQVTAADAEQAMTQLTEIAAGGQLAPIHDGKATWSTTLGTSRVKDYVQATAGVTGTSHTLVPDVLVGAAWPAVFAAVADARVPDHDSDLVVEGMLSLVHLEHHLKMQADSLPSPDTELDITATCDEVTDTDIGRIVVVRAHITADNQPVAQLSERFAIRGRNGNKTARTNTSALPSVIDTPRSFRNELTVSAPLSMRPFAIASGDRNPLHVSQAAARLAGLEDVIVHGMWTSALGELAATYDGAKLCEYTATMLAPVAPGAEVEFVVERTGIDNRPGRGEVRSVSAIVDGETVLSATAVMAAPRTFYAFPGQGIQSQGMGMASRQSSAAARQVWDRADSHTRSRLGFSVLDIVQNNPREVVVDGERFFHPDGVLFLTQFTQVAMATLGVAQIAEMKEAGVLDTQAWFAGHSVGEYNALAAYSGVLSLENVVEIVYRRGLTMHRLVERDENGHSNYGLAALRPHKMGVSADEVFGYVENIAHSSGEFLEIVNHNLAGRQYAVAGTLAGLKALAEDVEKRAPGNRALIMIPGIDVPFHSSHLRDGVDDFRAHLDALIPHDFEADVLLGRYIPNLVARPFSLERSFIEAMDEVIDSPIISDLLAGKLTPATDTELARTLLIELLAWQFASPVRWIETQDIMCDELQIQRFVEVGVGSAPTLANLMAQTVVLPQHQGTSIEVLNVERDRAVVFAEDEDIRERNSSIEDEPAETAPAVEETTESTASAPAATVEPVASSSASTERPADLPFTPADATAMLIALWTKVRPDQMGAADSIETLVEGVSSRRNQLLLDLGVEFGLGAIDGAADAELSDLYQTVGGMARGYQPFGPVLSDSVADALRRITGPTGKKASAIGDRVRDAWQLGEGWVHHTTAEIVLGAREGASIRGGDLATLSTVSPGSASDLESLIDEAVKAVGQRHGIAVEFPAAGGTGGGVVDAAALGDFAEHVTGETGVLAATARTILGKLGLDTPPSIEDNDDSDAQALELVSRELGSDWLRLVAPSFDPQRAVLLDDFWAVAREKLSRAFIGEIDPDSLDLYGAGEEVAQQAEFFGFKSAAERARRTEPLAHAGEVAVVTGASPDSIAAAIVAELLHGGATVVATTSNLSPARLAFYKQLYADHARAQAKLWVVPANLSSYSDLDALCDWVGSEQTATVGGASQVIKPALVPTILFPFAAPRVSGTVDDAGSAAETQMRLLLWSVERLVAGLSRLGQDTHVGHRLHVVLPGSPNRGRFGGDGAYGESKAALDALVTRWHAEPWGQRTTLVHALIGWVRGTGLMAQNDRLVALVENRGVETYSPTEIAERLIAQASPEVKTAAAAKPQVVNFTGGLDQADINLAELAREVEQTLETSVPAEDNERRIKALPSPRRAFTAPVPTFEHVTQPLEDMVVIVGAGELGPWGSSRTRWEAELSEELSAAGVVELAWSMGLIQWDNGWVDSDGNEIEESDIHERFHDEVLARCGVRRYHDDFHMVDNLAPELSTIYLDEDLSFTVPDRETAQSYVTADPDHTLIYPVGDDGEWQVVRQSGAAIQVPRRVRMSRFVGGQIPEGFDPAVYGIPADMIDNLDRLALWNIVCTVEAFLASGFSPAELLAKVHPARVSSTQGTGMGGVESMRSLYIDGLLAQPRPNDILQEALPNVVAAHVMQSYVGGYGQMIHPVAACATAAVSVEEGVDKIRLGKADVVVAGGLDDLSIEGITGFGDMAATADSGELEAKGIDHRHFSRANDRRRAGFVESEGGGTILLARGSTALELGLPVLGVVAFAESFADGAHTSIPAPGLGALSAARGGQQSRLASSLEAVGVTPDDISIVSKHDTSTNANDPNESDLHERIAAAMGRSAGNPLYVISQKTLTGHAKGGAAAFQMIGLSQVLRSGVVPANRSLDCVDPVLRKNPHLVWLRTPLNLSQQPPKAGLVTSLGFGHVSALIALVHPEAFRVAVENQVGAEAARAWQQESERRTIAGTRIIEEGMYGATLYRRPVDRNLGVSGDAAKEREAAVLLDEQARLVDGVLRPGVADA